MDPKRAGTSLFGVGLFVGSIASLFGVRLGCEVGACGGRGAPAAGAVVAADLSRLAVGVAGPTCGEVCWIDGVAVAGGLLLLAGLLVGGVGVARDALDPE
jgi:hypothetical protein